MKAGPIVSRRWMIVIMGRVIGLRVRQASARNGKHSDQTQLAHDRLSPFSTITAPALSIRPSAV
jgi:hypothetical protein